MTEEERQKAHGIAEALLRHLRVEGSFDLTVSDEGCEMLLQTKDSGLVIGYHGEALEALQLILSLCVSKELGRFVRVSVEVGDYKKQRTDYLSQLAQSAKERVLVQQQEVAIPNLRSWERRVVHLLLQNDNQVYSESVGVGRDRTLIVRPR